MRRGRPHRAGSPKPVAPPRTDTKSINRQLADLGRRRRNGLVDEETFLIERDRLLALILPIDGR